VFSVLFIDPLPLRCSVVLSLQRFRCSVLFETSRGTLYTLFRSCIIYVVYPLSSGPYIASVRWSSLGVQTSVILPALKITIDEGKERLGWIWFKRVEMDKTAREVECSMYHVE